MPIDRDRGAVPVGPGERAVTGGPPAFEADPEAWFAWVERALAEGQSIEPAARTARWADRHGRSWRVVVAPNGVEIRPDFGAMVGEEQDQPVVAAILLAPPLLYVEVAWRSGQDVARVGLDEVSVCDVGLAMLSGTELPHESITRVGPDTWRRARERWRQLVGQGDSAPVS